MLDSNCISKYILMFDEMYLQKQDEYAGRELTGADPDESMTIHTKESRVS